MIKDNPSVVVVGAGAIGGITAALLKKGGYNVTLVAKYREYADKIRSEGIHVTGYRGAFTVTMPAVAKISELTEKADLILLATKAGDMASSAQESLPLLNDGGLVVSMQNGICEYELAKIAGVDKTVGCVVGWGATMTSPGELEMTSAGDFILGYLDRKPDYILEALVNMMSAVVPAQASDNILGHLYAKLIINSCITSPGAVCGLYLGEMLSIPRMRRVFVNVIREAVRVADAMDINIETFGGRLDFYKFIAGSGFLADLRRDLTIRVIGFKYRRLKSSSLQSLERGKPTEITYLNGFIVDNAERLGVEVPVNKKITEMIRLIEKGQLSISIDNFNNQIFN